MRLRLSVSIAMAAMVVSPVVCREILQRPCQRRHTLGPPRPTRPRVGFGSENTHRHPLRLLATLLLFSAPCGVGASPCVAATPATSANQPPALPAPPLPSRAFAVYRTVDAWVRAWAVPEQVDASSFSGVGAAAVVLRLNGAVIGRGADAADEGGVGAGTASIAAAVRAALDEAGRRMPVENDALRDESLRQLAADVTISLELAGALIPLDARSFDDAAARLNPGVDGVAARVGQRTVPVFPSTILTQSLLPRNALASAVSQAGGNAALGLTEMDKLIDQHGARFYRFRTTHLAQPGPGAAPAVLTRGQRVFNLGDIGRQELAAMGDRIAEHLLTRQWPGQEAIGLAGAYDPCRDVYDPRLAPPTEQLTACLALVRFAATIDAGSPRRAELLRAVDRVQADLVVIEPGEEPAPADNPVTAAAWIVLAAERSRVIAAGELDRPAPTPARTAFEEACRRTVYLAFRMDAGYAPTISAPAHPLIALALVKLAAQEKPGTLRDEGVMLADAAIRHVFRNAATGDLVSRMPWLGWAELELAPLRADAAMAATALREMRTLVWDHQVGPTDAAASDARGGGPDMVGGIVFDTDRAGAGTPLPTWQSARPLAFIASMLADERFTPPADRPLELARLVGALRYLRQLQIDEGTAWLCENRRRADGGIRASTWDQRLPTDASALTLLTLCEALRALDKMK